MLHWVYGFYFLMYTTMSLNLLLLFVLSSENVPLPELRVQPYLGTS